MAFAKVDLTSGDLLNFGGKGTKTAVIADDFNKPRALTVKFTGKYPKELVPGQLTVLASAESSDFGVANALVNSAGPTEIMVSVFGWRSYDQAFTGDIVFFAVFIGELPP